MVVNRKRRVIALGLFLFLLFSLLVAQFYKIQIIEGDRWLRQANRQHFIVVTEPYVRGRFVSNTSIKRAHPEAPQSFVIDIQKFHLYIDPEGIPAEFKETIAHYLMQKLNLTVTEQISFRGQFERKTRSRRLAMWLDTDERDQIKAWWAPFARKHKIAKNALFFVSDYRRSYPFGKLLGQALHTIQEKKDDKHLTALPTGGLELYFNHYLQGKPGKRRLMRSPRNELATGEIVSRPVHGADVHLTINHILQAIAEEEVEKGVKNCGAKGGFAVMMNPNTGEVLALAQYPFFNPTDYRWYFNNPDMIDHTRVKAITDAGEPGSVMKPLTLAISLLANEELKKRGQAPLFDPAEKVATSNPFFHGRKKELKDVRLHHFLNMNMALQKSSNIYHARLYEKVVEKMGSLWLRNSLKEAFGLGMKTGIELPGEAAGLLPLPGKRHPNGTNEWSAATPYSLAMGHNVQLSFMQLLRAYAVFANGGYLVKPTLVRKIVKSSETGQEVLLFDNSRIKTDFPRVLPESIAARVVEAMKYVTKKGGTSVRADVLGFTEAGKSGTANKCVNGVYSENKYSAFFIGFTPVKNPEFVLLVTMDEPEFGYIPGVGKRHHGGTSAAPVFKEIATRSLEYLGVSPDDPYGYPTNDPRFDAKLADWALETDHLKEMYEKWNIPK